MKTKNVITLLAMLVATTIAVSCKKSSTTNPAAPTAGFIWKENGGADITADSAVYIFGTGGSTQSYVEGYKGAKVVFHTQKFVEMNLKGNTPNTYTCGPGLSDFVYWVNDVPAIGTGTVKLTSNTGGKATGTFDITFTGAAVTTIKGSFTDIRTK